MSVRPRIQREFYRWYKLNRQRFLINLHTTKHRGRYLQIGFTGVTPSITARLTNRDGYASLNVLVEINHQTWDIIFDVDALVHKTSQGYVCDLCDEAPPPVFTNRQSLWCDHLFEPLLGWTNKNLWPAKTLELHTSNPACGSTWATLRSNADSDDATSLLQLVPVMTH